MRRPVIVKTPEGEMKANHKCPRVSLNIKGVKFEANLIVLELVDIDVILGIGWLSACKGVIKYAQRSVFLTAPSGEELSMKVFSLYLRTMWIRRERRSHQSQNQEEINIRVLLHRHIQLQSLVS